MKVFAFEWSDCIYESAYHVVSLHTTKAGAFRAMTTAANARWNECRRSSMQSGSARPRHDPLADEAWRVREITVQDVTPNATHEA